MSPRERQIQIDESPFHVVDSGRRSSRVVLAVHGFPGADHMSMRNTPGFENLEGEARVVYYDQRGAGHSHAEIDPGGELIEILASDLAAVVDAMSLDRPIVIAHDAGAAAAISFAIAHSAALSGLVLVSPRVDLGPEPRQAFESQAAEMLEDPTAGGLIGESAGTDDSTFRRAMDLVFPLGFLHFGLVERTFMKRLTFHQQSYAAMWGAAGATSVRDRLSSLRVPTMLVTGRYDPFIDLATARSLADAISNCRFHLFQSSAHWPFLEEPQEFSKTVWDWADEVAAHIV